MALCPSVPSQGHSRSPAGVPKSLQRNKKNSVSPDPESSVGSSVRSRSDAQRRCVGASESPQARSESCTKAALGRCLRVYRAEKVQQRIIAAWLPTSGNRDVCKRTERQLSAQRAVLIQLVSPKCALLRFAGPLNSFISCPASHLCFSRMLVEDKSRNEVETQSLLTGVR